MLTIRPNRFLATLGGVFFTVFGLVIGYVSWRKGGVDMAIGVGMAVFAVSAGLHFLYLAATGQGVEHVSGTLDRAPPAAKMPVPQRLALLDDLHRRRAVTDTEYQQQRQRILSDI